MALAWAHCFFFSPCVCPLSSSHTYQPPPSPGHCPEAARRVPGAEAVGSESRPEAQAQQGRGVRAWGALSTGEHLLGLPDPSLARSSPLRAPILNPLSPCGECGRAGSVRPGAARPPAPSQACLLCCRHSSLLVHPRRRGWPRFQAGGTSLGAVSLRRVSRKQVQNQNRLPSERKLSRCCRIVSQVSGPRRTSWFCPL